MSVPVAAESAAKCRVAINGFGRMGRLAARIITESFPDLQLVHINEKAQTAEMAAHLLTFDSVHGIWKIPVAHIGDALIIDGHQIALSSQQTLEGYWADRDIDIVFECTGSYRSDSALQSYLLQGIQKVIVACPVSEGALNIVYGVNDHQYQADKHHLLTAASCTTNCLAPIVKVLHEKIGIEHGQITTIHDVTNTQNVHDAAHTDLRRARASSVSLVPTSTGSATAITMIYPELQGKLNGLAVRVPLLNASLIDCVFELQRSVTVTEVNDLFIEAADSYLRGILDYEHRPLVSVDFKGNTHSAIIDGLSTMVVDGSSVKILAWYDNEIAYVHRMLELAHKVARSL